jgi:hypothetical protein
MAFQVLNTALTILAILCTVLLYLDTLGKREVLTAWQFLVETRLDNHNARIVLLEGPGTPPAMARSAVGGGVPLPGRPAMPPPASREGPQSGTRPSAAPHAKPAPEPEHGPATPPRTAPDDARAARTTSSRPPPPVEVVQLPPETAPASWTVRLSPTRPTLFGGVVGGPAADPLWVEKRAAELLADAQEKGDPCDAETASRQAQQEGRLVGCAMRPEPLAEVTESPVVEPAVVEPPQERRVFRSPAAAARLLAEAERQEAQEREIAEAVPAGSARMDLRVAEHWAAKLSASLRAGVDVWHCGGHDCGREPGHAAGCECKCAACVLRASLLAEATREVHQVKN